MSKIILITGASSGIGRSCAEYLSQKEGYIVYGTSRKPESASDVKYRPLLMDVTSRQSVREAIGRLIGEQKRIDIVINNAGVGIMGALELATEDEIRMQMETNFHGVVNVSSEVIPCMRQQNSGKIINISSIGGISGLPFQGFYSASKFAVEGYSEALSIELREFGIKVVLIEPGDFRTNFVHNRQISQATASSLHYKKSFDNALAVITEEELNGTDPIKIAELMDRIIKSENPKFRHIIGKPEQIAAVYLKRILPARWYQQVLTRFYKLP